MGGPYQPQQPQSPISSGTAQDFQAGFNQNLGMHPAEFLAKVIHHLSTMSPKPEESKEKKE